MNNMTTAVVKGMIMAVIFTTDPDHSMTDCAQWLKWPGMQTQAKFQLTMHTFLEKQISKYNTGYKASKILIFPFSPQLFQSSFGSLCSRTALYFF